MTPKTLFCAAIGVSLLTAAALAPAARAQTAAEQLRAEAEARADQLRAQAEIRRCVLQNRANQLRGLPTVNCNAPAPTPTPTPTPTPPRDTTAPTIPARLTASATSCSEIQVSWGPSGDTGGSGLQGYDVYRDAQFLMQVRAPFASFSDGNLAEAQSYSYQVAAFDGAGNRSARSSARSATTPACVVSGSTGARLISSGPVGSGIYNRDIAVNASRDLAAVAVAGGQGGAWMQVIDLSDHRAPRVVGSISSPSGGAFSVAMAGEFALLTLWTGDPGHAELVVVDLGDPSRPTIAARVVVPGQPTTGQIVVQGSLAYVAASDAGLRIYDITNPLAPVFVGGVLTPRLHRGLAVSNGYAYYSSNDQLLVVDVRNPRQPQLVASVGLQSGRGLTVSNGMLYVIDHPLLLIFDLSNPSRPVLRPSFVFDATDVAVSGDRLFLSARTGTAEGVAVLDANNSPPTLVDHIGTPGGVGSLIAADGFIYAGDDVSAIDVIELVP